MKMVIVMMIFAYSYLLDLLHTTPFWFFAYNSLFDFCTAIWATKLLYNLRYHSQKIAVSFMHTSRFFIYATSTFLFLACWAQLIHSWFAFASPSTCSNSCRYSDLWSTCVIHNSVRNRENRDLTCRYLADTSSEIVGATGCSGAKHTVVSDTMTLLNSDLKFAQRYCSTHCIMLAVAMLAKALCNTMMHRRAIR